MVPVETSSRTAGAAADVADAVDDVLVDVGTVMVLRPMSVNKGDVKTLSGEAGDHAGEDAANKLQEAAAAP